MPGISQPPSGQNVATTSSVRPSSRAWVYAAMVARTPSTTSAYVVIVLIGAASRATSSLRSPRRPRSETEVENRLVEGIHVDRLQRREQLLVAKAGEEAVDGPLEVRDVPLESLAQAHVLEALRVQTLLLPRQVREVLRGNRWPPWIVGVPHLWRRGLPRLLAFGEPRERPDLHQRLLGSERAEAVRGGAAVHRQHEPVRETGEEREAGLLRFEIVKVGHVIAGGPVPAHHGVV